MQKVNKRYNFHASLPFGFMFKVRKMHDVNKIIKDFPIISDNKNVVFLDSAASSQKPQVVIDRVSKYYEAENANIHRGIYALSEMTAEFETARRR